MPRAFIGVGSNIAPEANVPEALERLAGEFGEVALSTIYRTRPLHGRAGADYWNAVVSVWTEEAPQAVVSKLRVIEHALGRRRTADSDADRPIDLDLVAHGDTATRGPTLALPEAEIATRPFLAVPLAELAPELELPGLGPVRALADALSRDGLHPLPEETTRLRHALDASRTRRTDMQ